ncbi:MAG: heme transporter HemC [Pelagibacteraceae bacterium]|nr:heme transporter HemC [Pelagibacteraceae bacterium]|tara:strand:+ start:1990 stop:2697 length:708 start_codon:yes stop_codon:yes gene_type:complete
MFHIFSPGNLFLFLNRISKSIKLIIIPLIVVSLILALFISPKDYIQGDSVRIMYVHVPSSWIALACFSFISFLTILNFLLRLKNALIIYKSIAPIGLIFCLISIVTGSLWGQPTWGTFWAWDARLTSMLVLLFFYILFIYSYKFVKDQNQSLKICSIISILGLMNLFIIKYSVDFWSTLHQPSSVKIFGKTSIHTSMMLPLTSMLLVFLVYCALIFLMKYRTEIIRMKRKGLKRL